MLPATRFIDKTHPNRSTDPMTTLRKTPHIGDIVETPHYGMVQSNREQLDQSKKELVFYEKDNPRCVVALLSERCREAALQLPTHLLTQTSKQLEQLFEPTEIDRALKVAFWDEYFIAQDNAKDRMRMEAVYGRICSRELFYKIIDSDFRWAWILKPPAEYMYKMRSMLDLGLDRMYEILKAPIFVETTNSKGHKTKRIDTKLVSEIIKAVAILDNRVRGAVTQKIKIESEQKNLHLHANASQFEPPKTHQEIIQQLANIQREINQMQAPTVRQQLIGVEKHFELDDDNTLTTTITTTED